ncbi:MAG: homoserine kinase [Methyloprofundus sp.]|nr:homoserine kinase [Methyloprofundus sp.]MBW6453033.1 homoserine kinase [Methyloprofundus sp.]
MSVYTSLSQAQIELFIGTYGVTSLQQFSGISAGIENTNYLLKTAQGDFVLTVYEHLKAHEVSDYLHLMQQLSKHADYYPCPLVDSNQKLLHVLANKPAALFKCLPGKSVTSATLNQCQSIASALARLHLSSSSIQFSKKNPRSLINLQACAQQIAPHLSAQDLVLLADELAYQFNQETDHLAQGLIHADLFKDNVLFVDDTVTGLLDFYAACCDSFILDVAVALNDWCISEQGVFEPEKQQAFLQAYQTVRVFSQEEARLLPVFLRRASLRFWVSRLEHRFNPRVGEITQDKDPDTFKRLLLRHRVAILTL